MTTVTLSLIAHTNVGKTTLARTLLRKDVGEVQDRAHVTDLSEAHELIAADGHQLLLWDTPGFGDSLRLLGRLRREGSPLGWFLHQVWDRFADRALWCSQQAVRNVREDADVVLYLVAAAEDPATAGHVQAELEILALIGKPVLMLLNQTGPDRPEARAAEQRWRAFAAARPEVADLLPLDAFFRCWVQETELLERVAPLLDPERRAALEPLAAAWRRRNLEVFDRTAGRMARFLARAAADREPVAEAGWMRRGQKPAAQALNRRLADTERALWDEVIADHGLEGRATQVAERVAGVRIDGPIELDPKQSTLWGVVAGGATSGLAADVVAGGLSFGAGALLGALGGGLFGLALPKLLRFFSGSGSPQARWPEELLDALARQLALRYLAVAHFGRGRGPFEEDVPLAHWQQAVSRAFDPRAAALRRHLAACAERAEMAAPQAASEADLEAALDANGPTTALQAELHAALEGILRELWPAATQAWA